MKKALGAPYVLMATEKLSGFARTSTLLLVAWNIFNRLEGSENNFRRLQ
jgi:hypothetical protein